MSSSEDVPLPRAAMPLQVGVLFTPKKIKSFGLARFIEFAAQKGVNIFPLDITQPLENQPSFDVLFHKLIDDLALSVLENNAEATMRIQVVQRFAAAHPRVAIVDPLEDVAPLIDRWQMSQLVDRAPLPAGVRGPKTALIEANSTLEQCAAIVEEFGFHFPIVAKPIIACGSPRAHELSLVFNAAGLAGKPFRMVAQEYVNHNAAVFKVYVCGDAIDMVVKVSLRNVTSHTRQGVARNFQDMPPVSFTSSDHPSSIRALETPTPTHVIPNPFPSTPDVPNAPQPDMDGTYVDPSTVEKPPMELVVAAGRALSVAMGGVTLFGFDMITNCATGENLIIDINYFSSFKGIPNAYDNVLSILQRAADKKRAQQDS